MRSPLEICHKSIQDHEPDNTREDILEVETEAGGHLKPGTGIDLFHIIVKSPTVLPRAKERDDHGTDRQHEVADEEILEVHDAVALAQRLNKAQNVKAQRARNRADSDQDAVDER